MERVHGPSDQAHRIATGLVNPARRTGTWWRSKVRFVVTWGGDWVLVGVSRRQRRSTMKVLGPFATADEARELANDIGSGDYIDWEVLPLQTPS